MTDIVERLSVAWEKQPGAAMTKINRILVERKDAKIEITHLRQLLSAAEKREKEARAKALEEAAQVADRYTFDEHALAQATDIGKAVHHQSVEIAAAIRALQSEER